MPFMFQQISKTDDIPRFREGLILRITLARIADVFNACRKLVDPDRQMAFDDIESRLRQFGSEPTVESPAPIEFAERCRQLAESAPNDKIQNILLMIAQVSETEAESRKE
jgi:hypothetical protein